MKLTKLQTRDLYRDECSDELGLDLYEEGDWDVDNKWQHITNIYSSQDGKFYSLTISRSGSPFTDWYYSYEDEGAELVEVKEFEEVTVVKTWEAV